MPHFHQHLTQPMDPEKKSLNFIFPTKYVIPKSLKFSHWPSKFGCGPGPQDAIVASEGLGWAPWFIMLVVTRRLHPGRGKTPNVFKQSSVTL